MVSVGVDGFWRAGLLAGAALVVIGAVPALGADGGSVTQSESVVVKAKRLLLKEKNSPSAVTELGEKQIAQEGSLGSTSSLLRQAPSVYVYQSGPGENSPVLSIRGTRGLEVASTLGGVPMQDLLNGGTNNYLSNRFTLDQIDSVSIYDIRSEHFPGGATLPYVTDAGRYGYQYPLSTAGLHGL